MTIFDSFDDFNMNLMLIQILWLSSVGSVLDAVIYLLCDENYYQLCVWSVWCNKTMKIPRTQTCTEQLQTSWLDCVHTSTPKNKKNFFCKLTHPNLAQKKVHAQTFLKKDVFKQKKTKQNKDTLKHIWVSYYPCTKKKRNFLIDELSLFFASL